MQWVMDSRTPRRMVIPMYLQIFVSCSSIRISSFTQTFSGSVWFPFSPVMYLTVFTSCRNSFQTRLASPPLFLSLCCFFNISVPNFSSQWQQVLWLPRRASKVGPQENNVACCPRLSSSFYLWTGTCWNINKHVSLAAVSWSASPTATPTQTQWYPRIGLVGVSSCSRLRTHFPCVTPRSVDVQALRWFELQGPLRYFCARFASAYWGLLQQFLAARAHRCVALLCLRAGSLGAHKTESFGALSILGQLNITWQHSDWETSVTHLN